MRLFGSCKVAVMVSIAAILLVTGRANAHEPSLSGIRVLFRKADVVVNVTTHISRLVNANNLPQNPSESILDNGIRGRLALNIDGIRFVPVNAHVIVDRQNDMLIWQSVVPKAAKSCDVLARLYPEDKTSKTVFSVLRDGKPVRDALLEETFPVEKASGPRKSAWSVASQYLREGITHILGGLDHIAFVFGLLLMGGTLKSLFKTVTAFTLAHSITLSLAATGVWSPSPRIVEPLIALSIVTVAVENLRSKTNAGDGTPARDRRPFYAFGFGLIHGFGFAGALSEVGLPQGSIASALALFNIGVEIGQASIVLAVSPIIGYLSVRKPSLSKWVMRIGSMVIAVAGSYWFVTRL